MTRWKKVEVFAETNTYSEGSAQSISLDGIHKNEKRWTKCIEPKRVNMLKNEIKFYE